jgi:HlyD family secretion protein
LRHPSHVVLLATVSVALLVAGCTNDDGEVIETAVVESGEVVQTVAAPARIEPAARATVSASVAGLVAELLVEDGDEVGAGDELVRLTSASLDEQVEQAEAAVASAQEAAAAARDAGVDLSPAIGAMRGQVDGVFPPLLSALESQVTAAESALEGAIAAVADTTAATDELRGALLAALDDDDLLDAVDGLDLDALADGPDGSAALATLEDARGATAQARSQLAATRAAIDDTSAQLASTEAALQGQADAAGAAQTAAAEAQIEQAARALEAAEAQLEGLVVTAPIGGVVELVRDGSAGVPDGGQLGDLGALDGADGLEGLERFGTGPLGGNGTEVTGPIAVGREVTVGQPLVRIFDLSSFHADVEVDEIDVVEVERGQPVQLTVDAYPGEELEGAVAHVAMAPVRGVTGGALYPVTVELTGVPDEVRLRTGLTASAEVEVRRVDAELVVPTSALLRRGGGEVVYLVRDGVAHETAVEVLAIGDEDAAIDGPLERGDEVVTIGVELVEDGDELP